MSFHSLRFDRAAATYGAHSRIQERMADALIDLAAAERPAAILELGCGTGNLTRRLRDRFPDAALFATDAAPRMLATAQAASPAASGIRWALSDASGEASAPGPIRTAAPFGMAASNALVQWFPDLRPHLSLIASLLAPTGAYLVSGFSRDNFPELNSILREPPFSYPDYPGHAESDIAAAAAASGFAVEAFREEAIGIVLPGPRALLESIRGLGSARRPEAGKPLTRARLGRLIASYQERYPCEGGVKATWKPWYARLRMGPALQP